MQHSNSQWSSSNQNGDRKGAYKVKGMVVDLFYCMHKNGTGVTHTVTSLPGDILKSEAFFNQGSEKRGKAGCKTECGGECETLNTNLSFSSLSECPQAGAPAAAPELSGSAEFREDRQIHPKTNYCFSPLFCVHHLIIINKTFYL